LNNKPQFKPNFIRAFQDNNFKQLATVAANDVKAQQTKSAGTQAAKDVKAQQTTSAGTQAATTPVKEARRRTAAFVRYLFE